jgi:hypothetical protein
MVEAQGVQTSTGKAKGWAKVEATTRISVMIEIKS